jgi:transcription-repair coupling factor (superfamily II helicase)
MDPALIREALIAEKERGGQSFYVCPRIRDLAEIARMLEREVPEVSFVRAHGRMSASELDRIMERFLARHIDVLLSTTIIESGLDIPSVNTMIVHDAHRLGLAQLYQLRGRIGRAGVEAHAYLTIPPGAELTDAARRRLEALAKLEPVGAGFSIASHDLDIRGAGSLLGEEQSGHLRDLGFDLFQTMLKRAVEALRKGEQPDLEIWAPHISLGLTIGIPESYIPDPVERAEVYWECARLETEDQIAQYAAGLTQRYGPLPRDAQRLFALLRLKQLCREAHVIELNAGPKGAVLTFRPEMPVSRHLPLPSRVAPKVEWRKNRRLVVSAQWEAPRRRIEGVASLLLQLKRAASQVAETVSKPAS